MSNIWKVWFSVITSDAIFTTGVAVIFMLSNGLDLSQIATVISAWLIASSLGQIPSGVFADKFGYKTSLVWGTLVFLVGTVLFALATNFWWFFGGFALMGFGSAMKQGADWALLYESLRQEKKEGLYKKIAGKIDFYANMFLVFGSIIGGYLYIFNNRWPFYGEIVLSIFGLFVMISIRQPKIKKISGNIWKQVKKSFNQVFSFTKFSKIFIFSALIGSVALLTIQYSQPMYKLLNINEAYFGWIGAGMFVLKGLGSWYSDTLGKIFNIDKYLVFHSVVFGLFLILIQKTDVVFVVLLILAIFWFMRGLYAPTVSSFINENVKSENRATMLSINSQILTIVTSLSLIYTGYMADSYSLLEVFFGISILSMLYLIFYVIFLRKVEMK